ncbi:MAG: NUDIX domain-containing protein [Planctomycetota bacterium]|nr:NUDIX domain-containing protein [Planctomycetaceae bacterium]MDQ3330679.1 NUDIX domain-containing protein [Planctomycetota bacterium]
MSNDLRFERPAVLTVERRKLDSWFRRPAFYHELSSIQFITKLIGDEGRFVDRERAEHDDSVMQIVAYGVVRFDRRILCVKRAKKSNRRVLRLKHTILFGGHVDSLEEGVSDPLEKCLLRELDEELGISPTIRPQLLGTVFDPTTHVGRLHLGLIFDSVVESKEIAPQRGLDDAEFVHSGRRRTRLLQPIDEIIHFEFDPWSSLFLASDMAAELLGQRRPIVPQLTFGFE